ncbi:MULTISPECIES: HalOD1 output domain-containing protein [Halorussus]|uniref:HalOD1 output domain-containing protein n=1 Tax=Halorussus TaxID=1070314 RepID=UPI0013B3A351|nr:MULTISPECIES: HalOD1 output domain-containing protein [Halorussus]NHN60319.1 hypothetical protein [Halorussus sp. JP-T4]
MTNANRDANGRPENAIYRSADHPAEGQSVSRTVVEAVATLEDADETELPALAAFVDPDALNSLFGARFDGRRRAVEGRVEFEYAGYRVAVESDGALTVSRTPADE